MNTIFKRLALAAVVAVGLLALPGQALAASCEIDLAGPNATFDLEDDAEFEGQFTDRDDDTFDTAGELFVRGPLGSFQQYDNPDSDGCTTEDGGREVVFPTDTPVPGVEVQRRAFVPTDADRLRYLDTFTNTSPFPTQIDLAVNVNQYSDDDARYGATSSGDTAPGDDDRWATVVDSDGAAGDYDTADGWFDWEGIEGRDSVDRVLRTDDPDDSDQDDEDTLTAVFDDVPLAPGETVSYLTVIGQAANGTAGTTAADLDQQPELLRAGLSGDEIARVRNDDLTLDSDGDGVSNATDNCRNQSNPDQADLDGDRAGDACDQDIDGDGLTNDQEGRLGTNPRSSNTDGDSRGDGDDRCPTRGGVVDADGCPAAASASSASSASPPRLRRVSPRRVVSRVTTTRRDGALIVSTTGRVVLPLGLTAAEACTRGAVAVQIKAGRRTVSSRRAKVRRNCTFRSTVRFAAPDRIAGRELRVLSQFLGNDRLIRRRAPAVRIGR